MDTSKKRLVTSTRRALTFRLGNGLDAYPYVDMWFCHGWQSGEAFNKDSNITLMSKGFGPSVPTSWMLPPRRMILNGDPIWVPREPFLVTDVYLDEGPGWRTTCRGGKLHSPDNHASVAAHDVASTCEVIEGVGPIMQARSG